MDRLSGPRALDALAFLIASLVCSAVNVVGLERFFFFICFVILRFVFVLTCLTTDENCLLKLSAIFFGFEIYLPLNLID